MASGIVGPKVTLDWDGMLGGCLDLEYLVERKSHKNGRDQ